MRFLQEFCKILATNAFFVNQGSLNFIQSLKDFARKFHPCKNLEKFSQGIQGKCILSQDLARFLQDLARFMQDPCKKSIFLIQGIDHAGCRL